MKKLAIIAIVTLAASVGCSDGRSALEVKPGSSVTLQKKDGVTVSGRLIEVKPEHLVVETRTGRTEVRRAEVTTLRTDSASALNDVAAPAVQPVGSIGRGPGDTVVPAVNTGDAAKADGDDASRRAATGPDYREVTLPAGTVLPVELTTRVGSEISSVEDAVRGTLRRSVTVGGVQAFAAGTGVIGHVTAAERSARVKGRGRIAFRFTTIDPPGDAERLTMKTDTVSRLAPATKKQDAAKIGGGAAGGAIIGGILGGGDGAAKGAAIGGAAGTGVVLSTRGKEVTLPAGTAVSVRLSAPLTVRVATSR
jgi:hypothetical protein